MGLLQGASELFPVSSLGHAVLVPSLMHWGFKQSDPSFVPFLVLLHLGTASALLVLYRAQWVDLIAGFIRASLRGRITNRTERLSMLLMVGRLPAAVLGVFLENRIKRLFASGVHVGEYLLGALPAGLAAYASAHILLRYFRSGRLDPYGWYCIAAGLLSLALLTLKL